MNQYYLQLNNQGASKPLTVSAPTVGSAWLFWVLHYGGFPGFLKENPKDPVEPYVGITLIGLSEQPYSIVNDELLEASSATFCGLVDVNLR